MLIFALLLQGFPIFAECEQGSETVLVLSVSQSYNEHTGQTEILLIKENDAPFCGLLLSLESAKEIRVVSCRRGEAAGKATLSYDEGSPLFVMLDCSENIAEKGVLARFWIDASIDDGAMPSVISAYAISGDDLVTVAARLTDKSPSPSLERLSSFSLCIEENGDESRLSFSGTVSVKGFAACVDVWLLDVVSAELDRLSFLGVSDRNGRFDIGDLSLCSSGLYCIIIDFSEYNRSGLDLKEEKTFVLCDGVLY